MRRLALALFVGIVLVGTASADDEPEDRPPAPLTPAEAADAALGAYVAGDAAALAALAGKHEPDPWLVADELAYRGEHDAAVAFAKAAPRVDTEKLPAYVAAWRTREPDTEERERLTATVAALSAGDLQKVIEATTSLPSALDTLVRIRLRHVRGKALQMLRRADPSYAALDGAAVAAQQLGWLGRAVWIHDEAALGAFTTFAWPRALSSWERLLAVAEHQGHDWLAAHTRGNLGHVHMKRGDYAKALSLHQRALAGKRAAGDKGGAANTLRDTADVHYARGDFSRAMSTYERALAELLALGDELGAARSLLGIGNVHLDLGDYAEALSTYEQAQTDLRRLGDQNRAAKALGYMGLVHRSRGDYDLARPVLEQALAEQRALGDRHGAAYSLANLGLVHLDLGDYAEALASFERGLREAEALGDRAGAAKALGNIGIAHLHLGDVARALSTFERAMAQKQTLGDRVGVAATLVNIGNVHQTLGDYAKALGFLERGLAAATAVGHKSFAANALSNIGLLHLTLRDHEQALSFLERALAAEQALGNKRGVGRVLLNLGNVHFSRGDQTEALALYEQSLGVLRAVGERPAALRALGMIGVVLSNRGAYARALSIYERVLTEQRTHGDPTGTVMTLKWIGNAHKNLGDLSKARRYFERSAREARSLRLRPQFAWASKSLAQLHLETDEPGRALAAAQQALDAMEVMLGGLGEEQGATAREGYASLFAIGALAAVREKDLAGALTFLESGRAGALLDALDKREALRWKAESLPPALRRADLEAQAAQSAARRAYDRASRRGNLEETRDASASLDHATEAVRAVAGRIQRELKQQADLFYPRPKTIYAIKNALQEDQALVVYGLCLDEAIALVLRKGGERVVSLGGVADVAAACEALDATDLQGDANTSLTELRELLVEPLALGPDVKQVLVSPEGPLCYLPFGALFDRTVALTPSGTTHVLLLGEERGRGDGILALGAPDYAGVSEGAQAIHYRGRLLTPLPASREEALAIGTTTLLGEKASEPDLLAALATSERWRAVHFACHGLVDVERPLLSSLALSQAGDGDGFLTALEVLRLDIPADLAVLSACETATGKIVKGEGIVGLTRAFMFAGSPRVLCSLWKVDDEATRALMVKFYELWGGEAGLGAAAALKAAQNHIKSQEKWKHPYYWAAWVLWGLPQ